MSANLGEKRAGDRAGRIFAGKWRGQTDNLMLPRKSRPLMIYLRHAKGIPRTRGTRSNLNHVALMRSGRRLIAFNCHGLEGYFRSPSVEGKRKLSRPLFGPAVDVRLVSIRQ